MSRVIELPDKLLDLIYDAATEQELWRDVLTSIADQTGSLGAIIYGQSIGACKVYFDYNGRLSEECNRAFKERHVKNPVSSFMDPLPVGRVVFTDEILPFEDLCRTLFYEEVWRPQEIRHDAMIPLAAKDDFRAGFTLCRTGRQGPFGEADRRYLEAILPHLSRSLRLGFKIDGYTSLQRARFDVLDRLAMGVMLLDRQSRIIYANDAAQFLGTNGDALRLRNGTIATHSAAHTRRLGELIEAALLGAPIAAISVPRAADARLLTILVLSVRGNDIGRFADLDMPEAGALLFLFDPTNRAGLAIGCIMDAYGLTQAEARVALAAASGMSIPEAAAQLGLSPNTIKTHLRKVFAKTGANRQAELAFLLAQIGQVKAPQTE